MIALEDAAHESAVDRAAVFRLELGQPLPALGERRAAFAGPDEGVEREPRHALGMALGEQRRFQGTRRDAVQKQFFIDVPRSHCHIIGAVRNVAIDRPRLVRAAVALVVEAPGIEAARGKPFHRRGIRPPGHLQVESGLRRHGRAVHEQDRPPGRSGRGFLPQEKLDVALPGPVLLAVHRFRSPSRCYIPQILCKNPPARRRAPWRWTPGRWTRSRSC